jgi:hypothetical protein
MGSQTGGWTPQQANGQQDEPCGDEGHHDPLREGSKRQAMATGEATVGSASATARTCPAGGRDMPPRSHDSQDTESLTSRRVTITCPPGNPGFRSHAPTCKKGGRTLPIEGHGHDSRFERP